MTDLVIVVGMTGVGKTSVVTAAQDKTALDTTVISYGTELLDTARNLDLVEHRDELTDMPRDEYDQLQEETAQSIADTVIESTADVVFLDTHAALDTPIGYRPGLTAADLDHLDPIAFVQVYASPGEIRKRRESDTSRQRTVPSPEKIYEQQKVATQMSSTFSVLTRAPLSRIENPDGELDDAVDELVTIIEQ